MQTEDKRSGWYMNTHAFADWQIKIMMDAVQQARCVSLNEATKIRENLLNLTSKRGRSRLTHMMQQHPGNVNVNENIGIYIETMLEAIYQHRKIEFQYTEINDSMKKVLRREGKKYLLNYMQFIGLIIIIISLVHMIIMTIWLITDLIELSI